MKRLWQWLGILVPATLILIAAFSTPTVESVLRALFPAQKSLLYPRASPAILIFEHVMLVGVSSLAAALTGIIVSIFLSRPYAKAVLPLGERLAALAQTLPPAAVLALSVPLFGFGFIPTIVALFLYGTLPIFRAGLLGLSTVPRPVLDAAKGLGMTAVQRLFSVELPLAKPFILTGMRVSVVVNVGTAAIGATIGAGGLGAPIVSGLVNQNPAFLTEGTILTALLALFLDSLFSLFDHSNVQSTPRVPSPQPSS